MAHNALNLDDHVASRAPLAVNGLEVLEPLADLIAEICQLLRRVLCRRVAPVASSALDLWRDWDAFKPARGSDAELSTHLVDGWQWNSGK
jgi:hypothetical protein